MHVLSRQWGSPKREGIGPNDPQRLRWRRLVSCVVLPAVLLVLCSSCLNPELVDRTTGTLYPAAPGDQPFLLVRVVNDTQATLDVPVVYDDGTFPPPFLIADLTPPGREAGVLLDWPILRVAIGDLDNPFAPAVTVSLPDGSNFLVPTGLLALRAGVDYNRGDAIIFHFTADPRSPAAIRASVAVIDGRTQEGPFTRADTFATVRLLLLLNGLGPDVAQ